jgi:hypothetical protein
MADRRRGGNTIREFLVSSRGAPNPVQLGGFVTSRAAESKAAEVARTVGGLKSVENDMRFK